MAPVVLRHVGGGFRRELEAERQVLRLTCLRSRFASCGYVTECWSVALLALAHFVVCIGVCRGVNCSVCFVVLVCVYARD